MRVVGYKAVVENAFIVCFNRDYLARLNQGGKISIYCAKTDVWNFFSYSIINLNCAVMMPF